MRYLSMFLGNKMYEPFYFSHFSCCVLIGKLIAIHLQILMTNYMICAFYATF